ncbi:MAG: AAA family ATPase [Bacteroidetes bacterium]|nr:AAA family ATPase [Bacteroidota bacterium]
MAFTDNPGDVDTENATKTPLQNLFQYIRDLYNASDACFDFEKESGNPKSPEVNFWEVGKLLSLAKQSEHKRLTEFSLSIGNSLNPSEYLLKIKRTVIPVEPKIPTELTEWATINRSGSTPSIVFKAEIEIIEKFEQSEQRMKDLDSFKSQSQSSLFEAILPQSLVGWIEKSDDKILRKSEKKTIIKFESDSKRVEIGNQFKAEFAKYFDTYEVPIKINEVYDALHTLHYELKGRDNKRLYVSFGLVNGKIGSMNYRNFLFHVPLKLGLRTQEIKLEFDTFAAKILCEQYFVELFDAHFKNENPTIIEGRKKEVLLAIDKFNALPKEFFFDADFVRTEFYDKGLEILGGFAQKEYAFFKNEELNYDFQSQPINNQITFSFSPIIQPKVVESQMATSKDANNIINKINELQASGNLHLIPDFFKKLFSIEGLEISTPEKSNGNGIYPPDNLRRDTEGDKGTSIFHHRFLFPLPYNDEQLEIAKRLNEQDAVTVKGPPGTGKSHTIANLISHFVAQGKSILVVSHNAKALSVLKDKLPRGIQDLAVSLVNEGKGNESLKASVNAIIRNLAQRYEEDKVIELESHLSETERNYANTLSQIYKAIQSNAHLFKIYNPQIKQLQEKTAYEWAIFLFEQSESYQPKVIKDKVSHTKNTEGVSMKLAELAIIGNDLQRDDFELINFTFLDNSKFLDLNELRKIEIQLQEITSRINPADYSQIKNDVFDEKLKNQITNFETELARFENSNIPLIIYKHPNFNIALLKNIVLQTNDLRKQIQVAEDKLLSYQIDLSAIQDTDPDILYQQLNQLIVKFGDAKTLGLVAKTFLDKNLKRFFDCKVNFIAANEIEQFKIIETEINRRKSIKQLSIRFNNYLKTFGLPQKEDILETLKEIDFTVDFSYLVSTFNQLLRERSLPQISVTSPDLQDKLTYLRNVQHFSQYKILTTFLKETKTRILSHSSPHPIIFSIANSIENVERANYELQLAEYRSKREKQKQAIQFEHLFREVNEVLPITATFIKAECQKSNSVVINADDAEMDLFFLKIDDFLSFTTVQTKGSEKLLSDLQTIKRNIEKQTADIIAYKTWFHKSRKVTYTQKAALNAWLNDLINIGKGFGKNTARNIASSITNMQVAKGAVPIWIMPQETAVTFFPDATPEQFDLLIIDEASQCDISSLNLVFRCKKSLIVGDENQTSVVTDRSIFKIERTNELLDKYLISHRFKTQFDVNNKNNSIYTISGVIYPNIVTLTEHFRCLPEIIGYSNRHVYNSDIVPLKTATEKTYGEPVEVHYVEDNYMDEYKPLIVKKVVEEIENYIIAHQNQELKRLPTVGILTLDSSNTKHQNWLIKQISQSELIKYYEDKLELLIGTSREFQGDERDIMFLTITASHNFSERDNQIRPPRAATTEEYMRIFNVAASRAKEKSVVVHSIHPDAVAIMNPECYRKRLIDYYGNISIGQDGAKGVRNLQTLINQVDANSGEFEKTVCKFLYSNDFGDFLFPQFEVGKYRIDFGLIKNNKKLAIECDGFTYHSGIEKIKEDITRQLILERAGWRFFRIQSTDWFYKNEYVSRQLLNWITENTSER